MSDVEVRQAWLRFQKDANDRAEANKQSQQALFDLYERYKALADEEKLVVDDLLIEEVGSPSESVRFDALALIGEFRIEAALPALRSLADRLEHESSPGAPYEWKKVNRMIGLLARH